jgi:hypothetical protein
MQKSTARKVCCIHPERMALQPGLDWTTLCPPAFWYYRRGLNFGLATLAIAHESLLRAACGSLDTPVANMRGTGSGLFY